MFNFLTSLSFLDTLPSVLAFIEWAPPRPPETNPVDVATGIVFFFVFALALLVRLLTWKPLTKLSWFIALTALFLCLEEISYGESIFSYPRPMIFGKPVDSVHDALLIAKRTITLMSNNFGYVAAGLLAVFYLSLGSYILYSIRHWIFRFVRQARYSGPHYLLVIALALIIYTQVTETFLGGSFFNMLEELLEFTASIFWLLAFIASLVMRTPGYELIFAPPRPGEPTRLTLDTFKVWQQKEKPKTPETQAEKVT